MEEKAFIRTEKFAKGAKGNRHLKHALRERVFKEGLSKDLIRIFGDPRSITHQAQPLSQKSQGYFFEVMASGYDPMDTEKIKEHLETRLQRKVVAVEHNDESTFHAHFMAAWNDDTGRALRLSMKDFKQIPQEVAKITGQKLTPKGQGRKRLSSREFYWNEEAAREKIAAMTMTAPKVEPIPLSVTPIPDIALNDKPVADTELMEIEKRLADLIIPKSTPRQWKPVETAPAHKAEPMESIPASPTVEKKIISTPDRESADDKTMEERRQDIFRKKKLMFIPPPPSGASFFFEKEKPTTDTKKKGTTGTGTSGTGSIGR